VSLELLYASNTTVRDTLTGPYVSANDATFTTDGLNESGTLTDATGVPVTKFAAYQLTLSSGTGSINLAALPGLSADETVVGTGLKVQALKLRNKSTNANKITVTKGASNGYGLAASGDSWTVVLSPGQSVLFLLAEAAPDVATGARVFDVTGTGSQILEVMVVLG
jgi:hypothetical protein